MTTVLLAFFFMLVIVAGMSIGVMAGRKPIAGSCGGVGSTCELCGGNPQACTSAASVEAGEAAELGRDAAATSQRKHTRTL